MNRGHVVLAVVILLLAGGQCGWTPTQSRAVVIAELGRQGPFPSAEEAIGWFVAASGAAYAGDCAATRSPDDVGKVCSTQIAERGDLRAFLIGRTFSEYSTWVFVRQAWDGWLVAAIVPLDFFETEPVIPWPA